MARILIVSSTVDGHTLKIGTRLKQSLERLGHAATLVDIRQNARLDSALFDHVVIGASIRYGKHRPAVYDFIEANRRVLEANMTRNGCQTW